MKTANTDTMLAALNRAALVHRAVLTDAAERLTEADAATLEICARTFIDAHRAHAGGWVSDDFLRRAGESWRRNLDRITKRSKLRTGEATALDISLIVLRYKLRAGSLFR